MADVSREHNASPMPGVAPNPDPALDISKEHHHEHLHHGANAEKGHLPEDELAYTTGTTKEPGVIPPADPNDDALHRRRHPERFAEHDVEKSGGFFEPEHVSLDKGSPRREPEEEVDPKRHVISNFYRKYRIFFHIFIGMLFTGWVASPRNCVGPNSTNLPSAGGLRVLSSIAMTRTGSFRFCSGSPSCCGSFFSMSPLPL